MFTIKPIDAACVLNAARETGAIVTAENHNVINGLGSAVCEVLGEGTGATKQGAGQAAARVALKRLGVLGDEPCG